MVKFSWLALIALLASFVVFGCTAESEDDNGSGGSGVSDDGGSTDTGDGDGDTSSAGTDMTLASDVYQNDDGVAICPVKGVPVEDITTAPMREVDGTTYYFC